MPSRHRFDRVNRLLVEAERKYDQPSYARALAALEDLGLPPEHPEVRFRRAGIMHALAEMRGDIEMLRAARVMYEELEASGVMQPTLARLMPELIAECREQEREALEERRS